MKLLLDTHIWLWSLLQPRRLSLAVARALQSSANELWLSPISLWELIVLADKGRIVLPTSAEEWINKALAVKPFREAPLTNEVAIETSRFELPHGDPADRFLVAAARVFGLTLVTADDRLIRSKTVQILQNRRPRQPKSTSPIN
ncbi:MAG TPA: type II toxin-antitoxin system VapC family toxin [Blastocatellia bacterium]